MYICICFIYTRFFRDIEKFNQEINIGKCNLIKLKFLSEVVKIHPRQLCYPVDGI